MTQKIVYATGVLLLLALPSVALAHLRDSQSTNVAFISSPTADGSGTFPTTGAAFADFTFANLAVPDVNPTTLALYDTVVLNVASSGMGCDTSSLSSDQKNALVSFVFAGGKLIIYDSECPLPVDYEWLPDPFTTSNPGAYGYFSGVLVDVEENVLSSADPNDPHFIDAASIASQTDAVCDMNVLITYGSTWCVDLSGTNYDNVTGPTHVYARYGTGLLIYNGLDIDDIASVPGPTGGDGLAKLWLQELQAPFNPSAYSDLPCGDCNGNGIPDDCDVSCGDPGGPCDVPGCGGSADCNENYVPDECEPGHDQDCNANGVPDLCDIYAGTSLDCNGNAVPDECEPGYSEDCNANGAADFCDIYNGASQDCNHNAVPDECDIANATAEDCNENGVPDSCDIADGTSKDCNNNTIPDECEPSLGACCYDDGSCLCMTLQQCEPAPYCIGDMNCDGWINFGDINPFVLYLSSFPAWRAEFPGCNPLNGDINCDDTYGQGSFSDINPFVALMVQCGGIQPNGCPCPGPIACGGPRAQGPYWAGPGTTCPTDCCTVVVPPGAVLEDEPNDCATQDHFNGGCPAVPPVFSPIACNQTIYGESGVLGGVADADWYGYTSDVSAQFTVTVEAEFDVVVRAVHADANDPCTGLGYGDVAEPAQGAKCTPVQITTRCLPAGTYWFVVAPQATEGVPCGADYKLTLECATCSLCVINCPGGAYHEAELCGADTNGGCDVDPDDPSGFLEPLPYTYDPNDPNAGTFAFCGQVWAKDGLRDHDWYLLSLGAPSKVAWAVDTEVPILASILFRELGPGDYAPPATCSDYSYQKRCIIHGSCYYPFFAPCSPDTWTYPDDYYPPGDYWFLVQPQDDPNAAILYGYPCGTGNDYQVTMTVTPKTCENEILAKAHANTENESNCADPPAYVDTYNSGCDAATPPGPVLTLNFDAVNAWQSRSFAVTDPNNPTGPLKKDYDWYTFNVAGGNRRFKVYLYADFPVTWEIWTPNQCTNNAGLIEGVEVPLCNDAGVYTRRCYTPGTYWLRVYPSGYAPCGRYYYLALTEAGGCSLCNFVPAGSNLDDPCDDVNDYDTNAGCDDPNAPPPHYMPFVCGQTYWGTIYAGLITGAPYYDPEWFTLTQTNTSNRKLRLTVTAEFLAHIEVYLSCTDYNNDNPIAGLDGITQLVVGTTCPNTVLTQTTGSAPGTVYYGRLTCVDQFGNVMTKYYPCAKGNNRWKVVTACIL